ncbi:MAG: PdxA family protein [Burkholderiaceae bacterium]
MKPIAITQGDSAGIGPEIVAKAFRDAPEVLRGCFAVGDLATMRRAAQCLVRPGQPELPVALLQEPVEALQMPPRCLPVLQLPGLPGPQPWGRVSAAAGRAAADCVLWAARAALRGEVAALVTAPLHKEALAAAGIHYPGHTELLQAEAAAHLAACRTLGVDSENGPQRGQFLPDSPPHSGAMGQEDGKKWTAAAHSQPTIPKSDRLLGVAPQELPVRMMLANEELRTVLVSIHVPLRAAIDAVTAANVLQTLQITHAALQRSLGRPARIAVAGLNPHAGEGGLFGREEIEAIAPAIAQARAQGIDAMGPFAPDTVFMRARHAPPAHVGEFDVVVAMYHDQGLIPVKYLGMEQGVNVTLGLPLVRTSPDHGTAFDIAGQGVADAASLIAAVRMARQLSG